MKNSMKILSLGIITLYLFSLTSCGKKDVDCSETIIIGSYFPAYPGSYWNYYNNNNGITKWKIASDYTKFNEKCATYFINPECYIQENKIGYSFYGGLGTVAIIITDIYPLEIGIPNYAGMSFVDFSLRVAFNANPVTRFRESLGYKTISIDNINSYENTLMVKEYDTLKKDHFYLDYFANNIGLVMRDSVHSDSLGVDTTRILWIKDYKLYN